MSRTLLSRRTCLACLASLGGLAVAAAAAPAWALSVMAAQIGDVTVLSPRGKITIGDGDVALRRAVSDALDGGTRKLVLDLGGVTSMDSSGLGELVSSYTTASNRGARLVLANVPARVADILTITQLISVFEVYSSVDQAIAGLGT